MDTMSQRVLFKKAESNFVDNIKIKISVLTLPIQGYVIRKSDAIELTDQSLQPFYCRKDAISKLWFL